MKLYHGTNCEITDIDLQQCSPNKDFGRGFYLTDLKKQADYPKSVIRVYGRLVFVSSRLVTSLAKA